jgi:hypothetical protein
MKQTAVEWLFLNLKSHFEHDGDLLEAVQISYEQAKEMEKENKKYFFDCGRQYQLTGEGTFAQVYNETYGGNK